MMHLSFPALSFSVTSVAASWRAAVLSCLICVAAALPLRAADRDRLEAFLTVTGFDVALESIKFSASAAPNMLGVPEDAFGADWKRLTRDVFDVPVMHDLALELLGKTLSDAALGHAAEFYASDLGQRLVVAENASHLTEDDAAKKADGTALVAQWVAEGSPRLEILKQMNAAIDASGTSVRALQEIQLRFLLAASAAGVIQLRTDIDQLRAMLAANEGAMRRAVQQSALAGAAFTYQGFSDAEMQEYSDALSQPLMQEVYTLMNAVQYEIMANRFEVLAARMADLHPGQDI